MPAPVISTAQMREWENSTWATGVSREQVIEKVGRLVARTTRRMVSPHDFVLILAGKGHNGDDGRAAFGHLKGLNAELLNVLSIEQQLPSLIQALQRKPRLIVDALFGIGLSRPLDELWCKAVEAINHSGARVLAVDVPSGLNADTGEAMGAAVASNVTLTLGAPKMGLLAFNARKYAGRIELAEDIGLANRPAPQELNWILPRDFANFPPERNVFANKGNYGHLGIVAGSKGFHGAGVLASKAAQRAQPGLVTLLTMEEVYPIAASQLQAVMVDVWREDLPVIKKFDRLLVGPGLAADSVPDSLKHWTVEQWRTFPGWMVADASALDWIATAGVGTNEIPKKRVITPHPGEAARMLGCSVPDVEENRPGALRKLSSKCGGCLVILKGAQTLIGRGTGPVLVNSTGNARMAQGGSGDVLAGYLSGLAGQSGLGDDDLKTIGFAVWQHGATGDTLIVRSRNWVVEELAAEIGGQGSSAFDETGG